MALPPLRDLVLFRGHAVQLLELLGKIAEARNIQHVRNFRDGVILFLQQVCGVFHPLDIAVLDDRVPGQPLEIVYQGGGGNRIIRVKGIYVCVELPVAVEATQQVERVELNRIINAVCDRGEAGKQQVAQEMIRDRKLYDGGGTDNHAEQVRKIGKLGTIQLPERVMCRKDLIGIVGMLLDIRAKISLFHEKGVMPGVRVIMQQSMGLSGLKIQQMTGFQDAFLSAECVVAGAGNDQGKLIKIRMTVQVASVGTHITKVGKVGCAVVFKSISDRFWRHGKWLLFSMVVFTSIAFFATKIKNKIVANGA